jgi:2-dehydropantoate 2-reductase
MRFVMIGCGAVGGYFGAALQRAGHEVVFVARGATLRVLREQGLTILCEHSESHLPVVQATDDIGSIGAADYVLISVKTWQVDDVARQLPALAGAGTRFLTLQNGVEAPGTVAATVGPDRTLGGLVRGFFELDSPGVVRHVGVRPTIIFGPVAGAPGLPEQRLYDSLTQAGVYSELAADIQAALWGKFLMVTALSGVGAVTRASIGEFRDYAPTRQMLHAVMLEITQVAQARGVALAEDIVERTMQFVGSFPPETTTSMQRDIMNGRPSELEAQTGAVVRLGAAAGVPTPINQTIYNSLILQERRARQA